MLNLKVDLMSAGADPRIDVSHRSSLLRVTEYGERQGSGEKVSAGFCETAKRGRYGESSK